jgi:serine/threonine-protein kinase
MHAMEPDVANRYVSADEMLLDLEEFRKNPSTSFAYSSGSGMSVTRESAAQATREVPSGPILKADSVLPKPVRSASRNVDLSREEYRRVNRRAGRTSTLIGIFLVIAFLVAVSVFIWKIFLDGIFNPVEEMVTIPKFIGQAYSDIENKTEYTLLYDFKVTEAYDEDAEAGIVTDQSPAPDRQQKKPASGIIEISLTVSKGPLPEETMPDLVNMDWRQAKIMLENMGLGLQIDATPEYNEEYTRDYVISTIPAEGEPLVQGQSVFITYSDGPDNMTTVPSVEGLSLNAAEIRLKDYYLNLGSVTYEESESVPKNQVISQGREPGDEVPLDTEISLIVSSGPPEPSPSPSEEPTTSPSEEPTTSPSEEPTTSPSEEPTTSPTSPTIPSPLPPVVSP